MEEQGIKGLGQKQKAVLSALATGARVSAAWLAECADTSAESARSAIRGLRNRGFLIETQPAEGWGDVSKYKLLPYPNKPWLPVSMIPDFYQMTARGEFTEAEAREIIERHLETEQRRNARHAA